MGGGAALGVGAAAGEDEAGAHAVAGVALLGVAAVRVGVALRPPDHYIRGRGGHSMHAIDDAKRLGCPNRFRPKNEASPPKSSKRQRPISFTLFKIKESSVKTDTVENGYCDLVK